MSFKTALAYAVGIAWVVIGAQVVRILFLVSNVDYTQYKAFERLSGSGQRIIVMGDSTARGLGSKDPATSTAGWMGQGFPEASIENISHTGLRLKGLKVLVPELKGTYDLMLLQIGANDIIHLTPYSEIDRDLREMLSIAKTKANKVVIFHSGDVGTAPLFIPPFDWIMSVRSKKVREIYRKATADASAIYVDLMAMNNDLIMQKNADTYYSPDRLHLSGEGYRLWYEAVRQAISREGS